MVAESSGVRRVVVLGAGGLLGTPLCRLLAGRPGVQLHAFGHGDIDTTDPVLSAARLSATRPEVIINCAAFTRVDECETQVERAMATNGKAPGQLAATAREIGARFVHVSSDYVFDGTKKGPYVEEDATGPDASLCVYGRSKLAGERAVQAAGGQWLVVRTSWVFGPDGPNFVASILRAARSQPALRVVNDQRGRPTYAPDLAAGILDLLDAGAAGLVHCANAETCTWFDFACEIVRRVGLATPVRPCTTAEFPRPARRPANSVLDTARFERLCGRSIRSWREGLGEYLARS